ncbi:MULTISPECIES: LysR family transcriptional regulator [unclassified Luteibacter]|uniref:LysR family transcriptional regulator n=1 Tax=unclassified Luteibacter TaxID=2620188 RepID=UPI0008B48DC6|nr:MULTISPECIES: LysR family transcriptional regulator [unclassified Luteibacter]MDR6936260.1 DNA-binding transcriptional LysR family regulator [Luteibacter sp. 3190]SEV87163.1 DNA-binding transcriptional regulator, LysR family [Luteibacter sp. 329MFSha]
MDDYLREMALFVEVVKAKGFRKAAEATGIPNSTLSRRITDLEKSIGLRLLHRTTRRIELTEAGQLYYERSKRIVDEARLAHEQLGDMLAQPTGVLRVSLSVDFALTFLAPLIAEFAGIYPGLTFDFDLTPRRVDLVSEPYDLAIRMGESADSSLVARKLATLTPYLFASPRYLERSGEPSTPEELLHHECFCIARNGQWQLHGEGRVVDLPIGGRFYANSIGMMKRLASLDQGIVLMTEQVVADEVAQGKLRRILPGWNGSPISVYAMTETRLVPAKTQRFIDFMKERLAAR